MSTAFGKVANCNIHLNESETNKRYPDIYVLISYNLMSYEPNNRCTTLLINKINN